MRIEDKKLYFISESAFFIALEILSLIATLVLYFFFNVDKQILIFSSVLAFLLLFMIPSAIREFKHRVFSTNENCKTFSFQKIVYYLHIVVNIFIIWFLTDVEKHSAYFGLSFLFLISIMDYFQAVIKSPFTIKNIYMSFKYKPYLYKGSVLNSFIGDKAIYILEHKSIYRIKYAFENYFTIEVQEIDTKDYDLIMGVRFYVYYKDKELRPTVLEKYMIENNKTFSSMTDDDILLLEMQNI